MLASPDSVMALEYQRSILASVIELLELQQSLLPTQPAVFVWEGEAQRSYVAGLARLRGELLQLRTLLAEALYRLGAACA